MSISGKLVDPKAVVRQRYPKSREIRVGSGLDSYFELWTEGSPGNGYLISTGLSRREVYYKAMMKMLRDES